MAPSSVASDRKPSVAPTTTTTITAVDNESGTDDFDAVKEVVSLHVLLRLHYADVLTKSENQTQSLMNYRRNLAWTLIQPQGSSLRKECWRWVTIIAEQVPTIFVDIIQNYVVEGQYAVNFLIGEHQNKLENWKASVSAETKLPINQWAEFSKKTLASIAESENTILHHAMALKLMQKLLAAYKDGDEQEKKALLAL